MLLPPLNFCAVEDGIYRSGMPTELNFQTLNLRTVVILSSDAAEERFASFMYDCNINPINLGNTDRGLSGMLLSPIAEETVIEVLTILMHKDNLPVLVTCKTGKNLNGVVIGCMRKLQRWSLVSIFEEYRRLAGHTGTRLQQQHEQFIELFDTDLVICSDSSTTPAFFSCVSHVQVQQQHHHHHRPQQYFNNSTTTNASATATTTKIN